MKRMLTQDMRDEWEILCWTHYATKSDKIEWFINWNFKQRG